MVMWWERMAWAVVGGLVGGALSAYITWRWTHKKWESTARAFKTTARYITRMIQDPDSVGDIREDEKGWLSGFDQIVRIEGTASAGFGVAESRIEKKLNEGDAEN